MSSSMFDTPETPTRAGLAEPHARAIAATMRKAVSDGVATKSDVTELRAEIGTVRSEIAKLKAEIGAVRADLRAVKWVLVFMFVILLANAARLFGVL